MVGVLVKVGAEFVYDGLGQHLSSLSWRRVRGCFLLALISLQLYLSTVLSQSIFPHKSIIIPDKSNAQATRKLLNTRPYAVFYVPFGFCIVKLQECR